MEYSTNTQRRNRRGSNKKRQLRPQGRKSRVRSARRGYPAIFLANAAATKMLVEIGALEPVSVTHLPEHQNVTEANLGFTVRRLTSLGLVRRFQNPEHSQRLLLTVDAKHPLAENVKAVLRSIGEKNGLTWKPTDAMVGERSYPEGPNVTALRVFGRPPGHIESIFGHPNRTMAVLVVGALGEVDGSTIARVAGVRNDGDMHRLLDPVEADGVFASRMVGSIRLYSFAPEPWAESLAALVRALLQRHPTLASRVAAGRTLMVTGGFSGRVHLRRKLGLETSGRGGQSPSGE